MPDEPTSQRADQAFLVWNVYLPNILAAAEYIPAELPERCEPLSRAALDEQCGEARS